MQWRQLNSEKIDILFIGKFNFFCYTTDEEGVISYRKLKELCFLSGIM